MNIIIIGNGGHTKVIRELIISLGRHRIIGYLDDKYTDLEINQGLIYGPISTVSFLKKQKPKMKFIIGIGSNTIRKKIKDELNLPDEEYISLIHPNAFISKSATIGFGTVVMAQAVIQADSHIGNHTIINTHSVVEHDNNVGDYVHICPNAVLTGAVTLGEGVQIGAGATVIPGKRIGNWSNIGAGAAVTTDLPDQCTAVGIPAKIIAQHVTGGV